MKEEPARKHEALVDSQVHRLSRRNFVKGSATLAAVTATVSVKPILDGTASLVEAAGGNASDRMHDCFNYRKNVALAHKVNIKPRADNGDAARFTDFSWCYSKGLPHDSLGIPNPQAILSLKNAFKSGKSADFANIIIGTPRGGPNSKLTCPQSALAFDLEGMDSHSTVIPPAPCVDSAQTAAEQVELYWAALLADVPFTEYATNELVGQAVSDMNNLSFLSSPANNQFPYPVTRQNLFRGQFGRGDGNLKGPYLSQFMIQPTFFGSQPINQQHKVFLPAGGGGRNYLTSVNEYQLVQNGGDTRLPIKYDLTPRYLRNGRDLAAYTRVDQPYQPYLVAFLVLTGLGAAPNPASPYIRSLSQKPFATLGGADAATTLAEMSTRALKAAWFHKWIKDMRIRPEEYGALVYARKTNASPMPQAAAALHNDVLNSSALLLTYSNYGTYLLPQPFPEGSPTHPCYPTGHGAVGGACITALKFFFNGNQKLRPLLTAGGRDVYEPSFDGLSLNTHSNDVRHLLDINGELNKLAYNVSFGHGIHAGIHFRSSTYWSILLGEQVALSVLQDRAKSYNEPFTISITKFDGTTATISNEKDVVRTD